MCRRIIIMCWRQDIPDAACYFATNYCQLNYMLDTKNDTDGHLFFKIQPEFAGVRLDKALSELLPDYSRASIQQWLKRGLVLVDGAREKQKFRLSGDETLEISIPQPQPADWPAQEVEFEIIDQDADILVINKPAGLVVHPGAGNADHTLLNGLLSIDEAFRTLPRAGIVHRLDKDTSGLLVVARSEIARQRLIRQLQDHSMSRHYLAVVNGVMVAGEKIDQPIGRHRQDRLRMCVTPSGKPAVTHIRVQSKFRNHCLIRAELETGRTHQIRVHMSWRGFPLVGDKLYTGRVRLPPGANSELSETLQQFDRQALHAERLSLVHPVSGEQKQWQQPIPADLQNLIHQLAADHRRHAAPADR